MMILSAELFITQHIFVMWALIENCMICGHGSIRHNVPETHGSIPRRGAKPNIWKFALSAGVCAHDAMTNCSQLQISCTVSSVCCLELQTKVPEDNAKFYNHGEGHY